MEIIFFLLLSPLFVFFVQVVRAHHENNPEEKARIEGDSQKAAAGCLGGLVGFFGVFLGLGLLLSSPNGANEHLILPLLIFGLMGASLGPVVGVALWQLWQQRRLK